MLGVGWRVMVTQAGEPRGPIPLRDPSGNAVGNVIDGDEVEILAWRPGRSIDPHYRVRSARGTEGWIDAANLVRKTAPSAPPEPATSKSPAKG